MGSLNASLSIASEALSAQESAIQVTDNNIANATTSGYSREIVELSAAAPIQEGDVAVGGGVEVTSIDSVRDDLLSSRIQQQTSDQAQASAQENALTDIQTLFPDSGSSIGTSMSSFFSSLSALSSDPASAADRQTVLSNAQDLVDQFHSVSNALQSTQAGLSTQVSGDVSEINQLTQQIASLNPQIAALQEQSQDGGALEDQRDAAELQLAKLTNISVTSTAEGDTITTGSGTTLVSANNSYPLGTSTNDSGMTTVVDSDGADITSQITSGDLGGAISTRDTTIPQLQTQVDSLANQFATAFNTAQSQGYDEEGNKGSALFTVPTTVAGSASSIELSTTDPSAIAASSDSSSAAGNGNITNLTAVQNAAMASGASPTDAYAALVDQVGNLTSQASSESSAISLSLTQLADQQGSVSGVSTDEESTNLIRYQQAYEAAAEVVSTVQSLMTTTINMYSPSGA